MKKILFVVAALFSLAVVVFGASDSERRAIARKLYGRIRFVDVGEDYRVRVVNVGEDLRVRIVWGAAANGCGQWLIRSVGEDYKVRIVDVGEDLRIRFVDVGEGLP